jgi:hypothetical protein
VAQKPKEATCMNTIKTHVGYIVAITLASLGLWVGIHSWLAEHDQRLVAQSKIEESEKRVADLEQHIKDINSITTAKVSALQARIPLVRTPDQVVAAAPEVSFADLPLNLRKIPNNVVDVQVAAQPLYESLNRCQQQAVEYGACQEREKTKDTLIKEKDGQIADLKSKPSFWKRVKGTLKTAGVSAVITLGLRTLLKGGL